MEPQPHLIEGLVQFPETAAAMEAMVRDPDRRVRMWSKTWYDDSSMSIKGNVLMVKEITACSPDKLRMVLSYFPRLTVYVFSRYFGQPLVSRLVRMLARSTPHITLAYVGTDGRQFRAAYPPPDPAVGVTWELVGA